MNLQISLAKTPHFDRPEFVRHACVKSHDVVENDGETKDMKRNLRIAALCLIGSVGAFAQTAVAQQAGGLPGVLDPTTGTFHAQPQVASPASASTISLHQGKIKVAYVAGNLTNELPQTKILCTLAISIYDFSSGKTVSVISNYSSFGSYSSNQFLCNVIAPYQATVSSTATVSMSLNVTIPSVGTGSANARANSFVFQLYTLPSMTIPSGNILTTVNVEGVI